MGSKCIVSGTTCQASQNLRVQCFIQSFPSKKMRLNFAAEPTNMPAQYLIEHFPESHHFDDSLKGNFKYSPTRAS